MKTRPKIRCGDLLRWSHRARKYSNVDYQNDMLLCTSVSGDGQSGFSTLEVHQFSNGQRIKRVFRREVWATGRNILDNGAATKTVAAPNKCTCDLSVIMAVGCKCGGK